MFGIYSFECGRVRELKIIFVNAGISSGKRVLNAGGVPRF
jgi:hypothetical protein